MKKTKLNKYVLGVTVTGQTVHAVLVDGSASEPTVLKRFMRQRNLQGAGAQPAMAMPLPSEEKSGDDFSIQFGQGGGGSANELFLQSEFGGLNMAGAGEDAAAGPVTTFEVELVSILEECREAGFPDPPMAFCVGTSEVTFVEVRLLDAQKKKKREDRASKDPKDKKGKASASGKGERRISRDKLIEQLSEQYQGSFDPERVAFLPMTTTDEGVRRYLAEVMRPTDPVTATLRIMRKQKNLRLPPVKLLDAEASIYLGLARALLPRRKEGASEKEASRAAAPVENTLIVRAGADNTLVMFLQGDNIRHYESMRSLTAFDAPETICSRVLLQQDEYGIEDVHHVLILSEEQEGELVQSFQTFFPGAAVKAFRQYLGKMAGDAAGEQRSTAFISATGTALRIVDHPRFRKAFEDINLLPKQLQRQRMQLPYSWHVLVLVPLLFITALFFTARFITLEQEIRTYRHKLGQLPPAITETDPQVLQARIDSLQRMHDTYVHALRVIDSLLVGSDRWSRALEKTAREAYAVTGFWIESWRPEGPGITISGNATSRARVVEFAERTEGDIQSLTFSEIRGWPVYSFTMKLKLSKELPEAAKYLRQQASTAAAAPSADGQEAAPEQAIPEQAPPVTAAALQAGS